MKCARCGREASAGRTTEALELESGGLLVVRHIPCYTCGTCGEVMYTGDVAARLEVLTDQAESLARELTVVNYGKVS